MAISFISQAAAGSTSTTITTPASGDYIIVFAYRNATTAPTLPSGYTNINTSSGNSNSYRIGYKVSDGTETTSGTWTNANVVQTVIYRGVQGIGKSAGGTKAAATTANIPTLALYHTNSTSWVVAFAGSKQTTSQGTPLAGATTSRGTQTGTTADTIVADTNGTVNSFAATTSANGSSVTSCGASVELIINSSASTFTDPMTASTQDTTKWGGNFGTLSWSPSGFTITNPVSYTGYGGIDSNDFYDLTSSSIWCNMPIAGNQSLASCETVPLKLVRDVSNSLFWYINAGTLAGYKVVNGTQTQIFSLSYNSSVHTWFRIKESSGTTTFDYSTDGSSWTTPTGASISNVMPMTSFMIEPSLGTFSAEASSTSAVWNSFNTTASGTSVSIAQLAANITASGGTQSISAIVVASASVSQSAAALTVAGGTQSVATIRTVAIAQTKASITATGGTQAISTTNIVAISQTGATITASGGTQAISAARSISISQIAASLTATGGTQAVASAVNAAVTQLAANITATGGTQTAGIMNIVSISQVAATVTVTTFSPAVSVPYIVIAADDLVITTLEDALIISSVDTSDLVITTSTDSLTIQTSEDSLTIQGGDDTVSTSSATDNITVSNYEDSLTIST